MESFKSIDDIPLQYPDWQLAELHSKSMQVGRPLSVNHTLGEKQSFCPCCGNPIQKQYIPLCENTKQLEFLGVGFPLYYTFLKYCIILLILETISSSLLNVIDDLNENYNFCIKNIAKTVPNNGKEVECTSISVYFSDIQDHLLTNTIVLRISYFATAILFFIYMRDSLRKMIHYFDERSTTYSDYTLIIKHLPSKTGIKEDLRVLLTDFQVSQITVIGAFDHIQKMQKRLKSMLALKSKRVEATKKKKINSDEAQKFLCQLDSLNKEIADAQRKLYQGIKQQQQLYEIDEIVPVRAIICVQTDEEKEKIIAMLQQQKHEHIPSNWMESDISTLRISQAPQPKQIIWENLNLPTQQKLKSYFIGWTITFLALAIITMLFYFMMKWLTTSIQHQAEHGLNRARALFYSLLIVIVMVNKFILSPLLHTICHYEKYFTKSKEEFGFTLKYLLSMFFTTAMMTIFVDVLTKNNIYSQSFGVIEGETAMIFINAFLIPLIWLVNPWTIFLKMKRWYYRQKAGVTQNQANNMMQSLPYQLGKRFAEIIKLMWLVALYQSLIPIGTMIAIIGLTLYYWIDKYNLLRRSSVKQSVSGVLTMRIMSLLQFSLILKQAGELFFDLWIRYQYSISTVICLGLAVLYFVIPKNRILQWVHHEKFHKQKKQFSDSKAQLGVSYEELHPITGTKMMNFVESISKKTRKPVDYFYQYKSIISKMSVEENLYSNNILKSFKKQIRQRQMRQVLDESNKLQLLPENIDDTYL